MEAEAQPTKKRRTRWGEAPRSGGSENRGSASASSTPVNGSSRSEGPSLAEMNFSARAAAAREALSEAKSRSAFTLEPAPSMLMKAAGAGMSLAAQQQLIMIQKLNEDRQHSVNSILESLKSRLPLTLRAQGKAAPQRFDAVGRLLDDQGNVVPLPKPEYATLKINKTLLDSTRSTLAFDKRRNLKVSKYSLKALTDPAQNPHYDPTLISTVSKSKRTGLRFVESGFYLRRQQNIERKNRLGEHETLDALALGMDAEDNRIAKARQAAEHFVKGAANVRRKHASDNLFNARKLGVNAEGSQVVSRQAAVPLQRKREDAFPEVEWWDLPLVQKLTPEELEAQAANRKQSQKTNWSISAEQDSELLDQYPYKIKESVIGHLVEHPVPIEPVAEKDPSKIPVAIFLTVKERKKMRRQRRMQREQEKQDKIRMGLIPPDPPKVKLSNLMRVLGEEASANPTQVEQRVRKQVAERLQGHEQRNAARKLTAEKKAEKIRSKWLQREETSLQVQVLVFSLQDVTDKKLLFKIHNNAKQLHLTGIALLCPGVGNLVVVEGGSRATKKYKALMLRRIKWKDGDAATVEVKDDEEGMENLKVDKDRFCSLVWEGPQKERVFKTWQMVPCSTEDEAIVTLQELQADNFWGMLKRYRDTTKDIL